MDKQALIEQQTSIKQQFESLETQVEQWKQEMYRLQGDYRTLGKLISSFKEPEKEKKNAAK